MKVSILQCATANPDGKTRALVIGGGIANFTDVASTFNGIIRALKEKVRQENFELLFSLTKSKESFFVIL